MTGATDGIGKSYAEEVRLVETVYFTYFLGQSVTRTPFAHRPESHTFTVGLSGVYSFNLILDKVNKSKVFYM